MKSKPADDDRIRRKVLKIDDLVAQNITFAATLKSKAIKLFVSIIRATNFVGSTELQFSENGLRYIAEESKSFQANAYIKKEFFNTYHIRVPGDEQIINFSVNLNSFTELLSAFLDNELSTMNIVYYSSRNCIVFTYIQTDSGDLASNRTKQSTIDGDLDDDGLAGEIATEYFMQTMQSVDPIEFRIDSPQLLNSVILNASDFHSVINDFDRSIEALEISINDKRIRMKTVGVLQCRAVAKFPQGSDIFSKYESHQPSSFVYNFKFFKHMLKSLALATKISLQTHVDGMIRIQLMMRTEDEDISAYMEYFVVPRIPDDESDDDD